MPHLVLLGDSVFDNGAYVPGEPAVVEQVTALLPRTWRASLVAVDGATIDEVRRQVPRVPADATHVVLSMGGNDALGLLPLLDRPARSSAQVLGWFADALEQFESRYRRVLADVRELGLPVVLCTIYGGNLGPPLGRIAAVALAILDDAIHRVAREHALPIVELRLVCTEPGDYANPIEPSVQGGEKLARAIVRAVGADLE